MIFDDLKEEIKKLEYPPNHQYDPETFEPIGELVTRIKCLQKTTVEMINGNESFLDIGSNKGFISFWLRNKYDKIYAFEPELRFVDFCNKVRQAHKIQNIDFMQGGLDQISDNFKSDVVYAGHFNHHCYNGAIINKSARYDFMRKLVNLAKKYLILDGPVDLTDLTVNELSKIHNWSMDDKNNFSMKKHIESISNEFEFLRYGWSGTSTRQILVFKRK